jgi:glycosyltransferase involved in cell wall biosynthesis
MRVLIATQFYPPLIGGEERFTYNLSRLLAARGHQVSVVTLHQAGLPERETVENVAVYRIKGFTQQLKFLYSDDSRRAATPFPDPGLVREIGAVIDHTRPDILHAHNWIVHSLIPHKRRSKAKLILTLHDYGFVCATKKLIYRDEVCSGPALGKCLRCTAGHYGVAKGWPTLSANWLMAAIERRAIDRFVPVSQAVAEGNGLTRHNLPHQVIPNFVPDTLADVPALEAHYANQLPDQPFLLFVGAFGRYKGVDVLIEAYRRLDNPPPLVLIGYDTSEHPVETQQLPHGVHVLRNWPHQAVMGAWKRCMIGFAPSVWNEPCATVPMEAMAVGKPVIATRIGGLTDIVGDGESGLLVTPGSIDELADAMARLIADPALRQRMGEAGLQRVRRFQESTVIPQYERLYQELLAPSAPPA